MVTMSSNRNGNLCDNNKVLFIFWQMWTRFYPCIFLLLTTISIAKGQQGIVTL